MIQPSIHCIKWAHPYMSFYSCEYTGIKISKSIISKPSDHLWMVHYPILILYYRTTYILVYINRLNFVLPNFSMVHKPWIIELLIMYSSISQKRHIKMAMDSNNFKSPWIGSSLRWFKFKFQSQEQFRSRN